MTKVSILMVFLIAIGTLCLVGTAGAQVERQLQLPPMNYTNGTIMDVASNQSNLTTFTNLTEVAELDDILRNQGPFTVFAPTNAAFDKLPNGTVTALMRERFQGARPLYDIFGQENPLVTRQARITDFDATALTAVMLYDVVPGMHDLSKLNNTTTLQTFSGYNLTVNASDGNMTVDNASVVNSYNTTNGILYTIDTVLLPPNVIITQGPNMTPPQNLTYGRGY
ncbi:MAG TPA: fasciclin domain-containing protein [Methanomicrobiales archaeon]|nr:fasciclin domain-containing protein [Methanomicrobiales archaeon]